MPRGPSSSASDLAKPAEAGAQPVGDGEARDRLVDGAGEHEADHPAARRVRRRPRGRCRTAPRNTESNADCHCSSVLSATKPGAGPPTLIRTPSKRPKCSRAAAMSRAADAGSALSADHRQRAGAEFGGGLLQRLLVAAGDDDLRAVRDERAGGGEAEAPRGPGDDVDAVLQSKIHAPILPRRAVRLQRAGGRDQADVAEGLREVAELAAAPPGRTPRRAAPRRCGARAAARTAPAPPSRGRSGAARPPARTSTPGRCPRRRAARPRRRRRCCSGVRNRSWPSSARTASTVPTTRGSSGGRKPTRGMSRVAASSSVEPYDCVKVLRSGSKPFSQTSRCTSSRIRRQPFGVAAAGSVRPPGCAPRGRRPPRPSPWSGRSAGAARAPPTGPRPARATAPPGSRAGRAGCSRRAARCVRPASRARYSESTTSPYTSSWSWSTAALPIRTGAEPEVALQPRQFALGQPCARRARPYMI